VPRYGTTYLYNFQAILTHANGNILLQYGEMQGDRLDEATIGIENADGTDGLQVAYNQEYVHSDMAILFSLPTAWLTVDVSSDSIAPGGDDVDIEVSMDAAELDPGIYTGRVAFTSNDPENPSEDVPVTFIVGGLGLVKGVVTDYNTSSPIEGATVTVSNTALSTVSDVTNAQGEYRIWITPGAADVTAEATGYVSGSTSTTVIRDDSVTVDFDLTSPIADIDTDSITADMAVGDTAVYQRVLTNTGSATLNYSVALEFDGGVLAGVRILTDPIERLVPIVNVGDHKTSAFDRAPYAPIHGDAPIITAFSDLRFDMDIQTIVGDYQCLGVEFDGTYFWITGAGNGADPNKLYKVSTSGVLEGTYDQSSGAGWGWRDLAFDGTYLYGSDDYVIDQIDPATGLATGVTISGPLTPNRALAYDPATDHFWTANWSSDIYEFDRDGVVINQYSNAKSAYGMAWQPQDTDGGPMLWVFSQDGSGANTSQLTPVDPSTGTPGASFQAALPAGYDTTTAGGACYADGLPGAPYGMILTLNQGFPTDYIAGYELFEIPQWLAITAGGSGTLEPTEQATVEFFVDFRDTAVAIPGETYLANAVVNNNTSEIPVIPMRFTLGGAGYQYVAGDANMYVGQWPPQVIGGDVTFLVNYFRGVVQPCLLDGFYCSGDANGDCQVIGSDVTRMVNYFRGIIGILPCPDYESAWPTPEDIPVDAPAGWPHCEPPPVSSGKDLQQGGSAK
jgi:hypothetical protein